MWEFYLDMALSVLFRVLKTVLKDPELKDNLRRAFLKLRDAIDFAYGGEDLFLERAFAKYSPEVIEKYGGTAEKVGEAPNPDTAAEGNPVATASEPVGGSESD